MSGALAHVDLAPVSRWRYGILGAVTVAGAEPGPQQTTLLAYLLIHANHARTTDQLIEALWDEEPPKGPRKAVQMAVKRLRSMLAPEILRTLDDAYVLMVADGELDAVIFERELERGRRALVAANPEEAASALRAALALWRGPALADVGYRIFAQGEIRRLEELRLLAFETCVQAELTLGRHADLVPELEAHVAAHPARQRVAEHLMLAYYRCGRHGDALHVYTRVRAALLDDGLHPGAGLEAMQRQILEQSATLAPRDEARVTVAPPALLADAARGAHVGRREELARLAAAAADCAAGAQRIAWIAGEAGGGKTTLAALAARDAHQAGLSVAYGAPASEIGVPFEPWVAALTHLVEHAPQAVLDAHIAVHRGELTRLVPALRKRVQALPLAGASDPETSRHLLFSAVAGLLEAVCERGPVLLVLDDLQWIDPPSLALLAHVVAATRELPLLILLAYRDTELPERHALRDLHAELRRNAAVEDLRLAGLSARELSELVSGDEAERLRIAERIVGETGGNPFFARELLHAADFGPTPPINEVVARRVGRLGARAAAILDTASVIGASFELDLLEALEGPEALDALDVAEKAAIVSAAGPARYAFAHSLIRKSLYTSLTAVRRAATHRRVGTELEARHEHEGARAAELEHHWTAAGGDRRRAARYARLAGEHALDSLAPEEALQCFGRALELEPGDCDALTGLGEAQRRLGHKAYRETLLEAGAIALSGEDPGRLARVVLANTLGPFGSAGPPDVPRLTMLRQALALVPEDDADRPRILAVLAKETYFGGEPVQGGTLATEALALARRRGSDRRRIADVLAITTAIIPMTPLAEHSALVRELTGLAEQLDDAELRFRAANADFIWAMHAGDPVRLHAAVVQMDGLDRVIGQPVLHWTSLWARSAALTLTGDLAGGEATALEAEAEAEAHGIENGPLITFGQLLGVYVETGRLAELGPRLAALIQRHPALPVLRLARGFIAAETGQYDEARVVLERAAALEFPFIYERTRAFDFARCADIALRVGALEHAEHLYGRLLDPYRDQFATVAGLASRGSVELALGRIATALGRWQAADRHLAAAAQAHDRMRAPLLQARTALARARLCAARGADGTAFEAEALRLARRHGAHGLEAEIRR